MSAVTDTDRLWCGFWRGDEYREHPAPIGAVCSSFDELFEAARSGRAIGLVPASVATAQSWPGLAFVPVSDIALSTVAICWRTNEPQPAIHDFRDIAVGMRTTWDD